MYVHQCAEDTTTEIELLAAVQATLRTAVFGNGRTFWLKDDSDIHEDAAGVMVASIYCTECEKFVVSFDSDYLGGKSLSDVEDALTEGEFATDGIVWQED
jgi:hypothetical protein